MPACRAGRESADSSSGAAASGDRLRAGPPAVEGSRRQIAADSGAVLGSYHDPLGGHWQLLAALPIDQVAPTPFQRDLSEPHVVRLARVLDSLDRFLDPIIAVPERRQRLKAGAYWTPNGNHRLSALRRLGGRSIVALVLPEPELAYKILALNTERAHNLREKALEVIRMARDLAPRDPRPEKDFAVEFEEPAFLTLGVCYEKNGRFPGGAYHPVLKRVDAFFAAPLSEALSGVARRGPENPGARRGRSPRPWPRSQEKGFQSPYLRAFVVARINPLRFHKGDAPDFDATLDRMIASAKKFRTDSVKPEQVFNEHAVLPKLFARLAALFDAQRDCAWRAVLVDDGSRDDSAALVRAQAARDARFELVELSRNFGFQAALAAGLAHARSADAVVTMDADLQDPPEVIPALVAAWRDGAEVVRARRRTRADTGLRRAGFDLFHAIFGRLSDYPIEPKTGTFGVLGRAAVDAFHQLPERNRFFPGLRAWIGFPTADVPYDRHERAAGKPQQTFRRLVRYALDGVFSFLAAAVAAADLLGNFRRLRRLLSWPLLRRETPHQDRDGADRLHHARRACAVSRRRATHRDRRARRISRPHLRRGETTPGLSREAAARVRLIMRGTAATLAAGALLVLSGGWPRSCRASTAPRPTKVFTSPPATAMHGFSSSPMVFAIHGAGHPADVAEELICSTVRVAVHITMLFSGDSKSWLSAFNREQNAATIFGRLLPNLYEARFPRTNAIPCFRWKFRDYWTPMNKNVNVLRVPSRKVNDLG